MIQFSSVLSWVQLFATPWTAARQSSLSITNWSLLKLMSIKSVMPSNHLILCCPLLLLPSIFPSTRVFSNEPALGIWSHHFMANRWGNNGNNKRLFLGTVSKITADVDCSYEVKRCLLLGRKAMTNLDSILRSRYITLLTKVPLVKAMVFPVVIYGCESWKNLSVEELMLLNCGVREDSWESFGLQGEPTSPF